MKSKRKITLAIMVFMVFGCIAFATNHTTIKAQMLQGQCGDNATYKFDTNSGLLTISGSGEVRWNNPTIYYNN